MTIVRELGIQDSDWEHSMSAMVSQTDMLTPPEANDYCKTPEYSHELATIVVPYVRGKLDTNNMGDMLFAISKAKETENSFQETRYRTIILGALMLRAGARIREEDRQHLLDLVPQINCTSRRTLLADHGFRTPGRAQFLAALDHYEPGVPRSLQEPRLVLLRRMHVCRHFLLTTLKAASDVERLKAISVTSFCYAKSAKLQITVARYAIWKLSFFYPRDVDAV